MFEKKKNKNWSDDYWNHIKRNIGLIKIPEQEKIRTTRIAILGVGGLGGTVAEQLVRTGCEQLIICDYDKFRNEIRNGIKNETEYGIDYEINYKGLFS